MSWSGFFSPQSDPSPLIFSICRYWVPIRYSALTNILLDNTAALRKKKYLHSLIVFFILLEKSIYFHMALSYSAYAIPTLADHLPCVSRWVCDSRPSCTGSWSVWDAAHAWYHCFLFLMLSCKMTWTRCLSISHAFSISSVVCFTYSAVWDPWN